MPDSQAPPGRSGWQRFSAVAAALPLLLLWDASGLDLTLALWFGTPEGFPLQYNPFLQSWLHDGARQLGWAALALLIASVWHPIGPLTQLPRSQRVWMVTAVLASLVLVVAIKAMSRTSCPWDLAEFGGSAAYVSHWAWGVKDGGDGRCFPGGHASTAFAFLALAVWLRDVSGTASNRVYLAVLILGFTLGWVQQARGAHYLSHTLWTGWICWTVAVTLHSLASRRSTSGLSRS